MRHFHARRFPIRYSLKCFFLFVFALSACLGLFLRAAHQQRLARLEIERLGGTVYYDFEVDDALRFDPRARSPVPSRLLSHCGIDFFHSVAVVKLSSHIEGRTLVRIEPVTDDELHCLTSCRRLRQLLLDGSRLTDKGFQQLGKLKHLEGLYVWSAHSIGDEGVAQLIGLRRLERLHVSDSRIGDAAVEVIVRLSRLKSLALHGHTISDAALGRLAQLRQLERLAIGGGSDTLTARGLEPFVAHPRLKSLNLQSASVSRDGVCALSRMKRLDHLYLPGAEIHDTASLRLALPDCQIIE